MKIDYGNKILNDCADLFKKYELSGLSMEDIANNLNIPLEFLIEQYRTKEEIILKLAPIFFKAHEKHCDKLNTKNDCKEEFISIMEHCCEFLTFFNPYRMVQIRNQYPLVQDLFIKHLDSVVLNKIKTNFSKGIKEGVYRKDINIDITAKLCIEQLQHAFNQLIFPLKDYSKKEVLNVLLKNQLYSICK